ncbi:hypothetical protein JJJ17_05905 [Paracoccus caeni]|uniref:Uncharacterized protein n=1 Tax=Paracoccus caeni TaxID=657651 RepID=A0A934SCM1_9RHOB|nr:hypothetical protein [Paracoccus caeni]MBK4215457.1 hypothetical protein [Paracoccus caeni]
MKPIHAVIGLCLAIALAGLAYWQLRDPWNAMNAPQAFVFKHAQILRAEDRSVPTDLEEEFGFLLDVLYEMQRAVADAGAEGYLLADPDKGVVTLHLSGVEATAPFPPVEGFVDFDVTALGVPPTRISRNGAGAIIESDFDGIGDGLVISMDFVPAADVSTQMARQSALAEEHAARIAAWQDELVRVRAQIAAGPETSGDRWRHVLPGWRATVLLPDWASFGYSPDFPRTEFLDPVDEQRKFITYAAMPGNGQEIFAAEREQMLAPSRDGVEVLLDQPDATIAARIDAPYTGVFLTAVEGIDYIIFVRTPDLTMIREVWAVAESLSDAPLAMNAALSSDFDALGRIRERGTLLEVSEEFQDRFAEAVAKQFAADALISRLHQFTKHRLDEGTGDVFDLWGLSDLICTVAADDDAPLSTLHEAFMRDDAQTPDAAGFTEEHAEFVRSGAFLTGDQGTMALFPKIPRSEAQWFEDGPMRTVGSEGPLYYLYLARPVGQFRQVCRLAGENALGVRAAEQIAMTLPVPDVAEQPDWVVRDMRRYWIASDFGSGLYQVLTEDNGEEKVVLDSEGERLIDREFGYTWDLPEIEAFEAGSSSESVGLWSYDGLQLLPEEFSDISERKGEGGQPLVRTRREGGDEWQDFSVEELRRKAGGE